MKPLIAIGLGTRDRPKMLSQILESFARLKLPEEVVVKLIICENGSSKEVKELVSEFEKKLPFEITFLQETVIGIVFMRNMILNEAINNGSSFLAFVDDDEQVDPHWLVRLEEARVKFSADVVQGHVEQHFPLVPNLDLLQKFFPGSFDKNTGDELDVAYTNNVLFDVSLVRNLGLRFNERFNLTGGSDSFFFSQLKEKGARIVFCKEAIVTETVPESRANIEWVLSRTYRNGYTRYLMSVEKLGKTRAFLKGLKTVFKVLECYMMKRSRLGKQPSEQDISVQRKCLRAKGKFDAMIGVPFTEYHVMHGD
ncbi:MAG: glycosyltransferase family 2 protein [Cyclobacteriaceae bacterium]